MAIVLAVYPSETHPERQYEIRVGEGGHIYCTCPAWRFQRKPPRDRTCKHLIRYFVARKASAERHAAKPAPARRVAQPVVAKPVARKAPRRRRFYYETPPWLA